MGAAILCSTGVDRHCPDIFGTTFGIGRLPSTDTEWCRACATCTLRLNDKMATKSYATAKRQHGLLRVCASERAKQFLADTYCDGDVLFCKFCQHSLDYVRVDTVKDHMLSKKHVANKELKLKVQEAAAAGVGRPTSTPMKQITLASTFQ